MMFPILRAGFNGRLLEEGGGQIIHLRLHTTHYTLGTQYTGMLTRD